MEPLGELGWITEQYWRDSDKRRRCRIGGRRFSGGGFGVLRCLVRVRRGRFEARRVQDRIRIARVGPRPWRRERGGR